jgi:hypothetical protein
MRGAWIAGAAIATALTLVAAPAVGARSLTNLPWPELLPPLPGGSEVQPGPLPRCERATMRCIEDTIALMRRLERRLGCDHRAVFATTYRMLTEEIRDAIRRDPGFFDDLEWLIYEDVIFADLWFKVIEDRDAGRPIPEAWRVAFDTAARGNQNAAQDLLLGINAHVQRDMPYVLAAVGQRTPEGRTRKPDHDRVNLVLERAYEPIVREIERRYDPFVGTTNSRLTPVDNVGGLEVVKGWREGVWRHAERLLAARSESERRLVETSIEQNAAKWARTIALTPGPPGYRAKRDAYCRAAR